MQPKESKSDRHFMFSIMKSILRFGACYGLWTDRRYDLTGRWWIARFGRSVGNRGGTLGG